MTRRATVLVADDQPIVAEALGNSLKRWYTVVAVVTALERLDGEIDARAPDVVLLDLSFGQTSSLTILPALVERYQATVFVILTAHAEPALADAALRAGALAYVVKHSAASELRIAIEEALAGRTYLTPMMHALGAGASAARLSTDVVLSDRQFQILRLLHTGKPYSAIAQELGISTKTVEYHVETVGRRLGINGKAQLTRWAERYFLDQGEK